MQLQAYAYLAKNHPPKSGERGLWSPSSTEDYDSPPVGPVKEYMQTVLWAGAREIKRDYQFVPKLEQICVKIGEHAGAADPTVYGNAGEHCIYCPASGVCRAQASKAMASISNLKEEILINKEGNKMKEFNDVIGQPWDIMKQIKEVETWMDAYKEALKQQVIAGKEFPGVSLTTRVTRQIPEEVHRQEALHNYPISIANPVV